MSDTDITHNGQLLSPDEFDGDYHLHSDNRHIRFVKRKIRGGDSLSIRVFTDGIAKPRVWVVAEDNVGYDTWCHFDARTKTLYNGVASDGPLELKVQDARYRLSEAEKG